MTNSNAQGQTQSTRRTEEHGVESTHQSHGEGGVTTASQNSQPIGIRIHGTTGERSAGGVVGGILTRMIAEKQERVREARECVEWYQREEIKRLEELAELEKLVEQLHSDEEHEHE